LDDLSGKVGRVKVRADSRMAAARRLSKAVPAPALGATAFPRMQKERSRTNRPTAEQHKFAKHAVSALADRTRFPSASPFGRPPQDSRMRLLYRPE